MNELTEVEVTERYLILLLGAADRPISSLEHLQKELFVLSKANPKIAEFVSFEKHYKGPYSIEVADLINNPVYYPNAYQRDRNGKSWLNPEGKKIYEELVKRYSDDPRFKELIGMIKMIREMYDKLSREELLFMIYITYPDYKEKSKVSDELLSLPKRKEIAKKLLKKGMITEKRYKELVNDG